MNRILKIDSYESAKRELAKINVSSQGILAMAPKAIGKMIKLTNVHLGAANILKQEMLSLGADAAVARGVVNGMEKISDLILLGNADKYKKLIKKLDNQTIFGLPKIQNDLRRFVKQILNQNQKFINCNGNEIYFDSTKIVGILNVTPDSFSDGNDFWEIDKAIEQAKLMAKYGANIIDIGGESTRPGAGKIDVNTELKRVIPLIKILSKEIEIPISIDTYKAEVAEKAIVAGASILNDISALRFDKKMINVLKENRQIPVILMHMQGTPKNMQKNPHYEDVIEELLSFFQERINFCEQNGVEKERIIIDPGIGFGKRQIDNLEIISRISEFKCLDVPVLLGTSRKSFIDKIYKSEPKNRLEGTLATSVIAFQNKIELIRVHDVIEHQKFLKTLQAIEELK